jgi:hypothetical protein
MRLTTDDLYEPQAHYIRPARRRSRKFTKVLLGFGLFGLSGLVAAQMVDAPATLAVAVAGRPDADRIEPPRTARADLAPIVTPLRFAHLVDPGYLAGATPVSFGQHVAPRAQFAARNTQVAGLPRAIEADDSEEDAAIAAAGAPLPTPRPAELAQTAPSFPAPPPRPADLAIVERPDRAAPTTRVARAVPAPGQPAASQTDGGSFLQKLFGGGARDASGPQLAYAAPQEGAVRDATLGGLFSSRSPSPTGYDRFTAVYDISSKTVHLPSGARLEAHSGLGQYMDDPGAVHLRMRGATPPALYDLREREALFHGVRAIRLTPINSSVHGRSGLLAHTYMLGPSGQSNGCVSFRNYDAFLQAFLRGEVKRLAVVAKL